jgi:hypothetical protein
MPLIIDMMPAQYSLPDLDSIIRETAMHTGLIAIMDSGRWPFGGPDDRKYLPHVAFYLNPDAPALPKEILGETRLVEIPDGDKVVERIRELKNAHPELVVAIRVELNSQGIRRAVELASLEDVEAIHVAADLNGNEIGAKKPQFIKDMLRKIHTAMIEGGGRDEITLIAGGGVALPEHMAKTIICGADLVTINLPLLIALECHLCSSCSPGMSCPAKIEEIEFDYGVGRMTNLIAAWHDQLIEVMGAMGMREVRRLRGDVGRAMFFEELEEETFGKLFGTRKESQ